MEIDRKFLRFTLTPPILSQCGTIFAMRLANDADRGQVINAASDNLKGLFDMLPVLRTGEAIIVGEAVSLPIRALIAPPSKDRKPDSDDPKVVARSSKKDGFDRPGGWNQQRDKPDYATLIRQWRKQDSHYEKDENLRGKTMNWINTPESSNITAFSYDEANKTLSVNFKSGATYSYYDISMQIFNEMKNAPSKGQFLAQNVKGIYRYARH